ncbi:MAG: hypothetical protein WB586_23610 [Chthoniobacterales bacterium]
MRAGLAWCADHEVQQISWQFRENRIFLQKDWRVRGKRLYVNEFLNGRDAPPTDALRDL